METTTDRPQSCLLITTCDRYRWMARLTRQQIERHWPGHPPIFFCGLTHIPEPDHLPLVNEPSDWLGILNSATQALIGHGYRQAYLVLDDHLPLGPCHGDYLNEVLPRQMASLEAGYIGLNGWGQGRPVTGRLLGRDYSWLENVSRTYPWKFQLHPALWNLTFLKELLTLLLEHLTPEQHTPWVFERRAGDPQFPLSRDWQERAYRICGARTTKNRLRLKFVASSLTVFKGSRYLAGKMGGEKAWQAVDERFTFLTRYYEGPYPIFWEGALRKGEPNRYLIQFLKFLHQTETLNRLHAFQKAQA